MKDFFTYFFHIKTVLFSIKTVLLCFVLLMPLVGTAENATIYIDVYHYDGNLDQSKKTFNNTVSDVKNCLNESIAQANAECPGCYSYEIIEKNSKKIIAITGPVGTSISVKMPFDWNNSATGSHIFSCWTEYSKSVNSTLVVSASNPRTLQIIKDKTYYFRVVNRTQPFVYGRIAVEPEGVADVYVAGDLYTNDGRFMLKDGATGFNLEAKVKDEYKSCYKFSKWQRINEDNSAEASQNSVNSFWEKAPLQVSSSKTTKYTYKAVYELVVSCADDVQKLPIAENCKARGADVQIPAFPVCQSEVVVKWNKAGDENLQTTDALASLSLNKGDVLSWSVYQKSDLNKVVAKCSTTIALEDLNVACSANSYSFTSDEDVIIPYPQVNCPANMVSWQIKDESDNLVSYTETDGKIQLEPFNGAKKIKFVASACGVDAFCESTIKVFAIRLYEHCGH